MKKTYSYFPGCSLATTARENDLSMRRFLERFDLGLEELPDWNCCGSSSAHSVDRDLALALAARNLFLAPGNRPLVVACPGCHLRLWEAGDSLERDGELRLGYERHFATRFRRPELVHFFALLRQMDQAGYFTGLGRRLKGIKVAVYYGCMLARPPRMRKEASCHGLMEGLMASMGADPQGWGYSGTCCGTFLSAGRPEVASGLVNRIMAGAVRTGAECVVTACAMCHLNLESRSASENRIPVFHFSELLSLALDSSLPRDWMRRHLIDPVPLLDRKQFL